MCPFRSIQICAISIVAGAVMLLGNGPAQSVPNADDYSKGVSALRSGDYPSARRYFESSLKSKDSIEESQSGLLQTLRETGAYAEAGSLAQDFLLQKSSSAVLHYEYGRILKEIGRYREAEEQLRRCAALASGRDAVRLSAIRSLGDLLEETGRRTEAESQWEQILKEYRTGNVKGSGPLGTAAVAAWRRGYIFDARDLFMDATEVQPAEVSLESLADFGFLFLEKYSASDALSVFRDCLKINKSYPEALLGISHAKKYESDLEVEAYADAALKVNPNLAAAMNVLAALAMEREDYGEAARYIDAALKVNPSNVEALSLHAFSLKLKGDLAGFAAVEKRVLSINPNCGKFYYILAENFVSRRKYQEAVELSRKAITLDPRLWGAHVSLGMNLMRVGDLEGGRKAIGQAFEGDRFNVWASNVLELFKQMDTFLQSRSEHFVFRMSGEDAPVLAPYASDLAEEVYAKLTGRYGFKPAGPLHVEIFPDHKGFAVRTLGMVGLEGALGVCFGKVIAMDSPRARGGEPFNWGSTLWHEFVHVMTLQMTNHNIPRWFSEGLSVYEEYRARPGWGDNLTNAFIQAYKSGKVMKASELNAGFVRPSSPEQIMFAYYQAALVCEMIEEKYGFDKIRQSLILFSENKPSEEVFMQALGLNSAQLDQEYRKYLDSRFKDIAARLSVRPDENGDGGDNKALMEQVAKNPNDFWANLKFGALLEKEGNKTQAEIYLKKAQGLFPQYVGEGNPYEILSRMYLEAGREQDALAQFKAWSTMNNSSRSPLLEAAKIYGKRKDWNSAVDVLSLSIYINPYDADVQKRLGEAAMEAGRWPAAIAAYKALVGLNASDPAGSRYDLARALLASGNRTDAKREVLKSLEIVPSYRKAQELLLKITGVENGD